jgi:hypothetical protein
MTRLVRSAALALTTLLAACATGDAWQTAAPEEGFTIQIALSGDVCGVVSAEATVTAPDMERIGPIALQVVNDTIVGRISNVPAGAARTVTVSARKASGHVVYEGSTQVDVVAGQSVAAAITLVRNLEYCPAVGAIDVTGTISNDPPAAPPPDGDVLGGPAFAFTFTDATLTTDGVLHFFDPATDRLRRLDLATRTLLPAIAGTADAVSMAVAPDGSVAYLGYVGGRMDVVELSTGTVRFFAAAPATVSSMIVTGPYLFTVDDSGAWDTHALFHRGTGARVAAQEWRDSSRSMVFSALQQKVYFLDSGVSPTDVHMAPVDLSAGTLGADVDSPYHGSYALPNPIRLLPDESGVIVGSGIIFNASDLTYRTSLGLSFTDVAFLGDRLYLIDPVGATTQLRVLGSGFDILSAAYIPGSPQRVFAYAGELVIVTQTASGLEVRFLAP